MELTKYAHACVTVSGERGSVVIDPGIYTPDAADLVARADAVLVTHEHPDHFDEELIGRAVEARPALAVFGPDSVVSRWNGRTGQVQAVSPGDAFEAVGMSFGVHGGAHAVIHHDLATVANVGYLVEGRVYHPGDAYDAPDAEIDTLLLPTSGPWTKLADAVEFVRRVGARRVVQIHELMASELGQKSIARFLGMEQLGATALTILPVGEAIAL